MSNCFSKMKPSAVFMNIGRGTTVDEADLADALYSKKIAGAVLDVFKAEPLDKNSRLWYAPNLFMTPHCADQDSEWLQRSMKIFGTNLEKYMKNEPLTTSWTNSSRTPAPSPNCEDKKKIDNI